MSNFNRNSERDKMLEEILSSVGKGVTPSFGETDTSSTSSLESSDLPENNSTISRAERAAASSANRAAYEKRSGSSAYGLSSFDKKSNGKSNTSSSVYSKSAGVKKNASATVNTSTGYTGTMNKNSRTEPKVNSDTNINKKSIANEYSANLEAGLNASELSGSISRLIDTFDGTSSDSEFKSDKKRNTRNNHSHERSGRLPNVRSANVRGGEMAIDGHRPHRRRKSRLTGRIPMVLILTVVIFTIAISLAVLIISVGRDMLAIGKSEDLKIVTIPEGVNTEDVAQILYDEGIIKMPSAFKFISKLNKMDTKYIAGDHELSPSNAYETIIKELTTDKSLERETVDVTFIEGCDIISAAKKLEEAGVCSADRFVYYFNAGDYGYEFEKHLPTTSTLKFNRMEGYLFPDTYTFYVNCEPEVVCQKIYKNFDEKFKKEYYDRLEEINMTLDEAVTLASIVQAESGNAETMKKIASVFENRLANSDTFPKLQSDPTSKYVENVIKENIEIPSEAMYAAYDTYQCFGLPPGAIGNPGIAAIEAVLYPDETDYYFFYANVDSGETFFAKTNEEHEENMKMVKEQQAEDDENNDDDE